MKPGVTVFATAKRPHLWMKVYNSIGYNKTPWEIVFVGPNKPGFELPYNFRFIESNFKPSQCIEIAARACETEFIFQTGDDVFFVGEQPLDRLVDTYNSKDCQAVSARFMLNGEDQSHYCHRFDIKDEETPYVIGVGTLLKKSTWTRLGGLHCRFIATMGDLDMWMRVYEAGGKIVLSDVFIDEYKRPNEPTFDSEIWIHDRDLVDRLWLHNGKAVAIRKEPLELYTDLSKTQGDTSSQWP